MTNSTPPSFRLLCLVALAAAACAAETEDEPTLDSDSPALQADTEADEDATPAWTRLQAENPGDLERVYLDDEHYTVVDPEQLVLGTKAVDGPMTWEYVRPHVFAEAGSPDATTFWQEADQDSRAPVGDVDPIDQLRRTVRVDAHGREWAVVDLDVEALVAELEAHAEGGPHDHTHDLVADAPGEGELLTPLAWGRHDCMPQGAPDGDDDQFLSDNTENRIDIASPTGRQTKAVMIDLNDSIFGFGAACSGVLVDDQYVLTAAHCVSNSIGGVAWPEVVCPLGNNASYTADNVLCQAVSSVILGPDWDSTAKVQHDYALLELITPVNPAMDDMGDEWGWMNLCWASDNTMDDSTSYTLGYPGVVGGGGFACNSFYNRNTLVEADNISECSQRLFRSNGSITGWTSRRIKTNHDVSGGNSGSGIYTCHDGACNSGDIEHLTGLITHHVNPAAGSAYNGGPKVGHFRSWASGILPSQ